MPIDRIDGVPGFPRAENTGGSRSSGTRRTEGATGHDGGDTIELSEQARLVASLRADAEALPAVREDRVAAVREALDAGTYEVDPRRVARAILEFEDGLDG